MTVAFETWALQIQRLHAALGELIPLAETIGVRSPRSLDSADREWFELLEHKLLPQLVASPWLIVAIVGGTNIGKSLIFNHLAGENASGVSPLAAGTKHPVCLAPPRFDDETTLRRLFEGFELRPWRSSDDPLRECVRNLMFWRASSNVPQRLLLLDTPDIDSDRQVNWQRADAIRHAADVLIAVLTQQKYNDAAVKQFFRKVAEADKPIVVVFNQCDLVEDRDYWPQWLATFTSETGASPQLVYVVPYDRSAAKQLRLPFHEVGVQGTSELAQPGSLREHLATLHFDAIKIRTLRGAADKVLDPEGGAAAYLRAIRAAGREFEAAMGALSTTELARVDWPVLPPQLLADEIRAWWDTHRPGWSRQIHGFYRRLGRGLTWPLRAAWSTFNAPPGDPLEDFQRRERHAIVLTIGHLLDELKRLSEVGNDTLRPRLAALLKGEARAELLQKIEASHGDLPPVDEHYREFLRGELDAWSRENPRAISLLRSLDQALAIARPAITVSLAMGGWILAGGIVHEAALHAATHSATELATEAAVTGGIAGGGEALVDATASRARRAAARLFGRLQARYAQGRAAWLADWLERELLSDLLSDLKRGAEVARSAAFQETQRALDELRLLASTARN